MIKYVFGAFALFATMCVVPLIAIIIWVCLLYFADGVDKKKAIYESNKKMYEQHLNIDELEVSRWGRGGGVMFGPDFRCIYVKVKWEGEGIFEPSVSENLPNGVTLKLNNHEPLPWSWFRGPLSVRSKKGTGRRYGKLERCFSMLKLGKSGIVNRAREIGGIWYSDERLHMRVLDNSKKTIEYMEIYSTN